MENNQKLGESQKVGNMNNVTLIGNITRDIELQQIGETSLAKIGLAINEKVKKNGEYVDSPIFLDVNVWGKQAENLAKYMYKGAKIGIVGRISYDTWDDKETGNKRSKVYVTANQVEFLTQKGEQRPQGQDAVDRGTADTAPSHPIDDQPPF